MTRVIAWLALVVMLVALVPLLTWLWIGSDGVAFLIRSDRAEGPFVVLDFVEPRPQVGAARFEREWQVPATAALGEAGGAVRWLGTAVEVLGGRQRDHWARLMLVQHADRQAAVAMAAGARWREVYGRRDELLVRSATLHAGAGGFDASGDPAAQPVLPGAAEVAVLIALDFVSASDAIEWQRAHWQAEARSIAARGGRLAWAADAAPLVVADEDRFDLAILLAFADLRAARAWFADPGVATRRALRARHVMRESTVLYRPLPAVPVAAGPESALGPDPRSRGHTPVHAG